MKIEDVLSIKDRGVEVDVLVSPRSGRSGIEGLDVWRKRLIIKVKAPPLDGKANKETEETLSKVTGLPSTVVSGYTSRQKTILIEGNSDEIISKLREYCE